MQEFTRIKIEDQVYICNRLNPLDALDFGMKVVSLVGPVLQGVIEATKEDGVAEKAILHIGKALKDKEVVPVLRQAIGQCFTSDNQALSDEVTFNKWFMQYPGHLFHLGALAVYHLARPFIPQQVATMLESLPVSQMGQTPKA